MAKKDELLNLAQKQSEALLDADMAAQEEALARESLDQSEKDALAASHAAEASALGAYNQAQFKNQGEIISAAEAKMNEARQKDETARKRENAFRYISGLGDTLSGVANLVGTARGAANQQQTYNSHAVVQKAEAARKARKLEMDDLSKRLDEMKARQRDLQAAGSLKEAELKVRQDKETAALAASQRKAADEAKRYADSQSYRAMRDATEDWQRERTFNEQQRQYNEGAAERKRQFDKTYNLQYAKFKEEQKGNKYNFTFSDGSIDIPKEKINDVNVERIFQMLPEEIRKGIKGEATTEYSTDEYGQTVRKTGYKAPSINQKLAAIGAYAESDIAIKNELRRMADMNLLEVKKTDDGEDFSAYKVTSQTSQPQVTQLGLDWKSHFKDWQEPALPLRR